MQHEAPDPLAGAGHETLGPSAGEGHETRDPGAGRETSDPLEGSGHAPPWIFGITNLPFGVAGGYAAVAMPFMLSKAGLDVETIARMSALSLLPAAYQLFWAPVVDIGLRRRAWLILVSCIGALCLGWSMTLELPRNLIAYQVLMVAGQFFVGLVASCNGALVSTTLPDRLRGRAAGWVNAGNLGAAALGGGVVLTLTSHFSTEAAAVGLVLMIVLPSLAALAVPEAPPSREKLVPHLGRMAHDVCKAVKARKGWTGLLFCISPVGTAGLSFLFSALGNDYHVPDYLVEWVNGYGGGFVTATGALIGGYFLDRINRRTAYLLSGALTALCGIGMALAPLTPTVYVVGSLVYLLATGFCYAAFSAVVYEIVGTAGSTASTLYSVFPAAGNQAIAYVLILDGMAHKRWGPHGLLFTDAALNLLGICALLLLMRLVFSERTPEVAITPEPAPIEGG